MTALNVAETPPPAGVVHHGSVVVDGVAKSIYIGGAVSVAVSPGGNWAFVTGAEHIPSRWRSSATVIPDFNKWWRVGFDDLGVGTGTVARQRQLRVF